MSPSIRAVLGALFGVLALTAAGSAGAADAELRMARTQAEVERRLLDASRRRLVAHVVAEGNMARAVEQAAVALTQALQRRAPATADGAAASAVATPAAAAAALADAERALASAMAARTALSVAHDDQSLRVAAAEGLVSALEQRGAATPLDGAWDVAFDPGRRGLLNLSQIGTLVTGDYAMADGARGSVTGTFAGGLLRLDRVDESQGKDAILEARLAGERLDGTWLATVFGRGLQEAGKWTATRRPALPPPAVEEGSAAEPGEVR